MIRPGPAHDDDVPQCQRTSPSGIIACHFPEVGEVFHCQSSHQHCVLPLLLLEDGKMVRTFGPVEAAGQVEVLASDDDNLLAVQQLLRHSAGQAAHEMALAIDNHLQSHRT